jgi:hypothetical protein
MGNDQDFSPADNLGYAAPLPRHTMGCKRTVGDSVHAALKPPSDSRQAPTSSPPRTGTPFRLSCFWDMHVRISFGFRRRAACQNCYCVTDGSDCPPAPCSSVSVHPVHLRWVCGEPPSRSTWPSRRLWTDFERHVSW